MLSITQLPNEVQVHILSYLRSYDLNPIQRTCRFYNNSNRIHEVVNYFAHHVYGKEFANGALPFSITNLKTGTGTTGNGEHMRSQCRYTINHLRSIELAVVAHVLSLPEPKTGFYVSKSWIKKTLLWLEVEQQKDDSTTVTGKTTSKNNSKKKLTKKQQRQRNRRLSDVTQPWPNVNSDILCEHQNLQRSGAKAARSHRRLMDKKSWKILKKLYPDSTQLESARGECLQCLMEAQALQKNESDKLKRNMLLRKQPLSNSHVRRFYTRTKGIPKHCLVENKSSDEDVPSPFASQPPNNDRRCPLISGTYVILPRSWCKQWRYYIKTGEGCKPLPPDSSALLCDAHKLALIPPHLEAFLSGKISQLFASVKQDVVLSDSVSSSSSTALPRSPVGMAQPGRILDPTARDALVAAGISRTELAHQHMAMMQLEDHHHQQQRVQQPQVVEIAVAAASPTREFCCNELLDRENHVVIELVTHEEWLALEQETGCWGGTQHLPSYSTCITVEKDGTYAFSTPLCFECDSTGLRFSSPCMSPSSVKKASSVKKKFRSKRWEPKNVEQKRVPNIKY